MKKEKLKEEIKKQLDEIYKIISELNYKELREEILSMNTIKFIIILNDEITLSIIKQIYENEIIFNLYKNKECIASDTAKIDELINAIKIIYEE